MNIYLLTQTISQGYDTHDSCVVIANSPEEAICIHPEEGCVWSELSRTQAWTSSSWARTPDQVNCTLVGVAELGSKESVVVASFNAG